VLTGSDASYDSGAVNLNVARTGDTADDVEAAVALRNLRVSGWDAGDPARRPSYQPPPPAAVPGPPRVGRIYFTQNPDGSQRAAAHQDVMRGGGISVYVYADIYDISPPNTIKGDWLWNDSFDGVSHTNQSFTPRVPTGYVSFRFNVSARGEGGKLTLVMYINGTEAARGSLLLLG
jgi:hypothetical protein